MTATMSTPINAVEFPQMSAAPRMAARISGWSKSTYPITRTGARTAECHVSPDG